MPKRYLALDSRPEGRLVSCTGVRPGLFASSPIYHWEFFRQGKRRFGCITNVGDVGWHNGGLVWTQPGESIWCEIKEQP